MVLFAFLICSIASARIEPRFGELTHISDLSIVNSPELLAKIEKFAYYSKIAYYDAETIYNWNCGEPCEKYKGTVVEFVAITDHENQAFVAVEHSRKLIIVSFRGTRLEYLKNDITDMLVMPVPYSLYNGAKVHRGFYAAFKLTFTKILPHVRRLLTDYQSYNVALTGHSLGGAFATLTALELKQKLFSKFPSLKSEVITFGQPRLGNDKFASYAEKEITLYRVIFSNDLIPHIPFQWMGYQQIGGEIWVKDLDIPTKGGTVRCEAREDPNCSNSIPFHELRLKPHFGPYFGVDLYVPPPCNCMPNNLAAIFSQGNGYAI
ncbi:hypothetical protein G9A89_001430 [Geosiphon pyriformis]|nr:hypothetical protein G9A89_001430 [Geosiphon pyriformis]